MKLRIEKAFTDKNTREKYNVGDIKDFEAKRAKELLADTRNLVSLVEEPEQEPANEEPVEEPVEEPKKETRKSKK